MRGIISSQFAVYVHDDEKQGCVYTNGGILYLSTFPFTLIFKAGVLYQHYINKYFDKK